MANKVLLLALIAVSSLFTVYGLKCYQCDSLNDQDEACFNVGGMKATTCDKAGDFDMCYRLITKMEQPNNGPQDRLSDNDDFTIITRGCGTKKEWVHLANIDQGCDTDTIGGGGTQERCFCSGNECNSGSHITAGLALVATLTFAKFVL